MIDKQTGGELFEECLRMLLRSRGCIASKENLGRELIVTFTKGNYDTTSTVVIEVNGSATRGRAIVSVQSSGRVSLEGGLLNPPYIAMDNTLGQLVKVRSDSPKILSLCKLVNLVDRAKKSSAVLLREGDTIRLFDNTCDSANHAKCDRVTVSHDET
jgi:hypothetical protein